VFLGFISDPIIISICFAGTMWRIEAKRMDLDLKEHVPLVWRIDDVFTSYAPGPV